MDNNLNKSGKKLQETGVSIEVYMEITYRIFTWIITCSGWLLLLGFFTPVFIILPFLFPLIFGGLLYYSWNSKLKKDILTEIGRAHV